MTVWLASLDAAVDPSVMRLSPAADDAADDDDDCCIDVTANTIKNSRIDITN